ncbi:unnamed protein product, partial [Iphiclides podalirius]
MRAHRTRHLSRSFVSARERRRRSSKRSSHARRDSARDRCLDVALYRPIDCADGPQTVIDPSGRIGDVTLR